MPGGNTPRYGARRSTRTVTCACSPSSSADCSCSLPSPWCGCHRSSRPGLLSFGWMKSAGPKPWPMRRSRPRPIRATPRPSISSTAFSMTTSAGGARRPRNTGRAASVFSPPIWPMRPSPPGNEEIALLAAGITLEELRVENVVLRIQANPVEPHGAVADFVLVRTRQEREVSREAWTATMQFVFMPVIPADLVVFNPMGIQVTYLETDRTLITETP